MSKYRTPLVIEISSKKRQSKKSCRYQLPFQKDEPFEDHAFTLVRTDKDELMIAANIKLPKIMTSLHSNRASQMSGRLSNRSQVGRQSSLKDEDESVEGKEDKDVGIQARYSELDEHGATSSQEETKMPQKIETPLIKSSSPIILPNKNRRRYLSEVDRYPDDTFIEPDYSQTSQYEQTNTKLWRGKNRPLAVIEEIKQFKTEMEEVEAQDEGEEGEDQRVKHWRILSVKIRQYVQQIAKKQNEKINPKTKSKKRIFFSLSKKPKLNISEREALQLEISKIRLAKNNKALQNGKSEIFLLKKQSLNTRSQHPKEQQTLPTFNSPNIAIQKIQKRNEFKPTKKKTTKAKLPLQFYIPSYELVKQVNPFFRKINQFGGCILLSIGKLIYFETGKEVYCQGDTINEIYIIIYGKIILTSKRETLKNYVQTGQTLAEEQLFEGQRSYIERLKYGSKPQTHRQDARTVAKSCLLKIPLRKYYKTYRHLQKTGCKQLCNLIDNLFRINYIKKLGNHHHHPNDRMATEILSTKTPQKKNFF